MVNKRFLIGVLTSLLLVFSLVSPWQMTWASTGSASISGVVTDDTGHPSSSAVVQAVHLGDNLRPSVTTDQNGRYSFDALPDGIYKVSTNETVSGGAKSITKTIQISNGVSQTLNFSYQPAYDQSTGMLSGTLLTPSNEALHSTVVTLTRKETSYTTVNTWTSFINADGTFQIGYLLPGSYSTSIRGYDPNGQLYTLSKTVTISANTTTELAEPFSQAVSASEGALAGSVHFPANGTFSDGTLEIDNLDNSFSLSLPLGTDGTFAVGHLTPGHYQVNVASLQAQIDCTQIFNVQAANVTTATFAFDGQTDEQVGSATVSFLDENGQPMSGANVTVTSNQSFMYSPVFSERTKPDQNGTVQFSAPPGTYGVHFDWRDANGQHYEGWQDVELKANTQTHAAFSFAPTQDTTLGNLEGTLIGYKDQPIASPAITVSSLDGSSQLTLSPPVDANGVFHLYGLQPGSYIINLNGMTQTGSNLTGAKKVLISANSTTQTRFSYDQTPTATTGVVTGQITDANQTPVLGANVFLSHSLDTNTRLVTSIQTDENGQYSIAALDPGSYELEVQGLVDDQLVTIDKQVTVTAGTVNQQNVTLTSKQANGTLQGSVLDHNGAPLQSVSVVAYNADQNNADTQVYTDEQGHFVFDHMLPGHYTVQIDTPLPDNRWVQSTQSYTLAENGTGTVNFTFAAQSTNTTSAVKGTVRDASGIPLNDALVRIARVGTSDTWQMPTNDQAQYSFGQLPPGSYTITVSTDQWVTTLYQKQITLPRAIVTTNDFGASPQADPHQSTAVNNIGSHDTLIVNGLQPGDVVAVYATEDATRTLATSTAVPARQTTANVNLALPSKTAGSIFVAIRSPHLPESGRVEVPYNAEPSAALTANQVVVSNQFGTEDTVTVTGLSDHDTITVYDLGTGNVLGTADATSEGKSFRAVATVTLPNVQGGKVQVTRTTPEQMESAPLLANYAAEPYAAPTLKNITVANVAGASDTILVKGANFGDVVYVYTNDTSRQLVGSASVGKDGTATVKAKLNPLGGTVYVSIKGKTRPESTRTAVLYYTEPTAALKSTQVSTKNRFGDGDTVNVTGLKAGDQIYVYDSLTKDQLLGTATATATPKSNIATASADVTLNPQGGTIYVTVQDGLTAESVPTAVRYLPDPPSAPDLSNITVINHFGLNDQLTVDNLDPGMKVKVYSTYTSVSPLATSTAVAADQTSATVNVHLNAAGGTCYVALLDKNNLESDRTLVTYGPDLKKTPKLTLAQVTTINRTSSALDTIQVSGLTEGETITVYDRLGQHRIATGIADATGTLMIEQANLLGATASSVRLTRTGEGMDESDPLTVSFLREQ